VGSYPHGYGWSFFILPYIEEESLYSQFDQSMLPSTGSNYPLCAIPIQAYNCPDNPQAGTMVHTANSAGPNVGGSDPREDQQHTSMCAVADSEDHLCFYAVWHKKFGSPSATATEFSNGAFGNIEGAKISQISDGLSKTLFVGEVLGGGVGTYQGHFWTTHNLLDTKNGINGEGTVFAGPWLTTTPGVTPNNCRDTGFASYHPGGCHFVFGDGHVQFLSENISQNTVLEPLTTRAGGESVVEP
jgi:prepilin-type processing-associated H-X9-DG protein